MDTMTKSGSKVAPVEEPAKGAGDAAPGAAGAGTATGGDASPSDAAAGAGEETKKSKAKRKKTEVRAYSIVMQTCHNNPIRGYRIG